MENIVEAEYKVLDSLTDKSTEELTAEANTLWEQMEQIGNVGLQMAAQAGARLKVIKERLNHGEWEDWCKENLKFSIAKAKRMMMLSEKMSDENSIFSNRSTLSDIGISKVYELLSAPEEVAEEVLENPEAEDMTVKELREEIRRIKAEKEEADESHSEQIEDYHREIEGLKDRLSEAVANDTVDALNEEIERLKGLLHEASDSTEVNDLKEKIHESEIQMEDMKAKLEKERKKAKKAKDSIEDEKNKAYAEATKKAAEEAKTEAQKETESIRKAAEEARQEIEQLKKKLAASGNENLVAFKVKADQLQKDFNSCLDNIDNADDEQAAKMKAALLKLINVMADQLE